MNGEMGLSILAFNIVDAFGAAAITPVFQFKVGPEGHRFEAVRATAPGPAIFR
jgi:hypothetical protein